MDGWMDIDVYMILHVSFMHVRVFACLHACACMYARMSACVYSCTSTHTYRLVHRIARPNNSVRNIDDPRLH